MVRKMGLLMRHEKINTVRVMSFVRMALLPELILHGLGIFPTVP